MGNTVNADGTVTARQEVNPEILGAMSNAYGKPGQDMMHEVTEAYRGALISQRTGVGVGPATEADVNNPTSVYNRAHNAAISQSGLVEINVFDSRGVAVSVDSPFAQRAAWGCLP